MYMTHRLNPSSVGAFRIALVYLFSGLRLHAQNPEDLNNTLAAVLKQAGFTGLIQATLEPRLGRPIHQKLANLGRLLWFDKLTGLHSDNTCAGCHSPTNGFGDSQSIAIGIQNNSIVGHNRTGPRNQRRTPAAINVAFFPGLMWNSRFFSPSGNPFDNSKGFTFPPRKEPRAFD